MIVYTYTCNDGVTRTRCAQHVPEHGPYAPHRSKSMTVRGEGVCVACGAAGWKALGSGVVDGEEGEGK